VFDRFTRRRSKKSKVGTGVYLIRVKASSFIHAKQAVRVIKIDEEGDMCRPQGLAGDQI
jgi:hypothetical protein